MSLNTTTPTANPIDKADATSSTLNPPSTGSNRNLNQPVGSISVLTSAATDSTTDTINPTAAVALVSSTNTNNPTAVAPSLKPTASTLPVPPVYLNLVATPATNPLSGITTSAPPMIAAPSLIAPTPTLFVSVKCSTPTPPAPVVQPIAPTSTVPPVLPSIVQPIAPTTIISPGSAPVVNVIDDKTPIQPISPTLTTPLPNLNDTTIPGEPILALTPKIIPIIDAASAPSVPVSFAAPPTIPTSIIDNNLAPIPTQPIPSTLTFPQVLPTDNIVDDLATPPVIRGANEVPTLNPSTPSLVPTSTGTVIATPSSLIQPTPTLLIPPKSTGTVISTPSALIPPSPVLSIPPVTLATVAGNTPAPIPTTPMVATPLVAPITLAGSTPASIPATPMVTTPSVAPTTVAGNTPALIPATPALTISPTTTTVMGTTPTTPVGMGVTTSSPPTIALGTNNLLNIQNGVVRLQFTPGVSSAAFNNEMGAFVVDDEQGRIKGILPGAPGYLAAAMATAEVIGGKGDNTVSLGGSRQLIFKENTRLGFYLVQDGSTAEIKADLAAGKTPTRPVFFQTGNADGEHLKVKQSGSNYTFNWEDTVGGGDRDFNDLVINATISNSPQSPGSLLQGLAPSVVDLRDIVGTKTANVSFGGNSSFNNAIGFYRVDNLSGMVGTLNPGDPGYAQAAISRKVDTVCTTPAEGTISVTAGIFAPYIIANGNAESFLAKNPTNQASSSTPNAYFAFLGANSDKVDHVRLLGDNKFGFEDMFGGGDRDFNDGIVQLRVTT